MRGSSERLQKLDDPPDHLFPDLWPVVDLDELVLKVVDDELLVGFERDRERCLEGLGRQVWRDVAGVLGSGVPVEAGSAVALFWAISKNGVTRSSGTGMMMLRELFSVAISTSVCR